MGRRKKEPRSVHREHIASAAQTLFMEKGIQVTSMDDIARVAGYSKATLYVYFENKEEIVIVLVLESMKKLYAYLSDAFHEEFTTKKIYDRLCNALLQYQKEYPFYFQIALDKIDIEFEEGTYLPEEKETYRVGEKINECMIQFLRDGIKQGDIRKDIDLLPTIFTFWATIAGLIQMAIHKEAYIMKAMQMTKREFLTYGFDTLYHAIAQGGNANEKQ